MVEPESVTEPKVKPGLNTEIGARFRQGREAAGIPVTHVAAAINAKFQSISQFELGKQRLDLEVFTAACEVLRLNVRWVLLGRGAMQDEKAISKLIGKHSRPARRAE